jgi:hypothetical protein
MYFFIYLIWNKIQVYVLRHQLLYHNDGIKWYGSSGREEPIKHCLREDLREAAMDTCQTKEIRIPKYNYLQPSSAHWVHDFISFRYKLKNKIIILLIVFLFWKCDWIIKLDVIHFIEILLGLTLYINNN